MIITENLFLFFQDPSLNHKFLELIELSKSAVLLKLHCLCIKEKFYSRNHNNTYFDIKFNYSQLHYTESIFMLNPKFVNSTILISESYIVRRNTLIFLQDNLRADIHLLNEIKYY